jgi:hypothetical protein
MSVHSYMLCCSKTVITMSVVCTEFPHIWCLKIPNHCSLLLFGACGKQIGHFNNASGTRQLNGQGKIHHWNNREILCLWLHMDSAVGPVIKNMNAVDTFDLPSSINWLILRLFSDSISTGLVIWHWLRWKDDHEWCVGNDLEGGGGCLIETIILVFAWRDWRKPWKPQSGQ